MELRRGEFPAGYLVGAAGELRLSHGIVPRWMTGRLTPR